jgi:hypothetical protein
MRHDAPNKSLVSSQQSWPRGLRIIFWLTVLGLFLGAGQTAYWLIVTHEFYPGLTVQGAYAAVALALTITCVLLGAVGRRRAFATVCLIIALVHIAVTVYFSWDIFRTSMAEISEGRWQFLQAWDANSSTYVWNSMAIGSNAVICYYLVRNEFRWFGVSAL